MKKIVTAGALLVLFINICALYNPKIDHIRASELYPITAESFENNREKIQNFRELKADLFGDDEKTNNTTPFAEPQRTNKLGTSDRFARLLACNLSFAMIALAVYIRFNKYETHEGSKKCANFLVYFILAVSLIANSMVVVIPNIYIMRYNMTDTQIKALEYAETRVVNDYCRKFKTDEICLVADGKNYWTYKQKADMWAKLYEFEKSEQKLFDQRKRESDEYKRKEIEAMKAIKIK